MQVGQQRTARAKVEQLAAAADGEDGDGVLEAMAHEVEFEAVFGEVRGGVGGVETLDVGGRGRLARAEGGGDVLAFAEKETVKVREGGEEVGGRGGAGEN